MVSIHALTRRATLIALVPMDSDLFQSTPSRGGRQTFFAYIMGFVKFQSTPSRGGRPGALEPAPWPTGFNPRPHAEGDLRACTALQKAEVSIHALTRRATLLSSAK